MTHLTPQRIPVGYSLTRPRTEMGYRREELPKFSRIPRSRLTLPFAVWKYRKLDKSIVVVTEGRKRRPYNGRVAMLVNEHTTSGAEIIAGFASDHHSGGVPPLRAARLSKLFPAIQATSGAMMHAGHAPPR